MAWPLALFAFVATARAQEAPRDLIPVRLEDLLPRVRPSAAEASLAAELLAARQELASTSRRLAAAPSLAVTAGPRLGEGSGADATGDVAADLDLPLWNAPAERAEYERALDQAERLLPAAERAATRGRLVTAYLAVWVADREAALRANDRAGVERWLALAARRVEQGAEAPFELDLLALEVEQARAAEAEAQVERARAVAALRELVDSAPDPEPDPSFDLPSNPDRLAWAAPALPPARGGNPAPSLGLAAAAIEARLGLAKARSKFESVRAAARWSLRVEAAREDRESVARAGLAYRFPLARERSTAAQREVAEREAAESAARIARAERETRIVAARARLALAPSEPSHNPEPAAASALAALDLRLVEGKSRPSEVLPLRRAIAAAEIARHARRAAHLAAAWELWMLVEEELP